MWIASLLRVRTVLPVALLLMVLCLAGCATEPAFTARDLMPSAEPRRGRYLLTTHGCQTCHVVPGVPGAVGTVGPPLTAIGRRSYLAGRIENNPENMVRWIHNPTSGDPQTVMPVTGISEEDARHVASFLYTLR